MCSSDLNKDIGLVGSYAYTIDRRGKEIYLDKLAINNLEIQRKIGKDMCFTHGTIIFRKECLEKVGNYQEAFKFAHDYDLILRISEQYKIANIPEPLYKWRVKIGGISVEKKLLQIDRKSTRLNSSHTDISRMPSSA